MNVAERQILDRARNFLMSGASDAVSNGVNQEEWERVCKEKAIEDLEILQLLDDSGAFARMPEEQLAAPVAPAAPVIKEGHYKGFAGGPPEYE